MKQMFLVIAIFGILVSGLDFFVGMTGWGFFLLVLSGLNLYNYFTWDKKMAEIRARHEALVKEFEDAKTEQQRKIDELYGK